MKFDEIIQKLNPMGKRSFNKVSTEADRMELEEANNLTFSPKSVIKLRLVDSSDSEGDDHTDHLTMAPPTKDFFVPRSDFDTKVYNSPTHQLPSTTAAPTEPLSLSIRNMLGLESVSDDELNLCGQDFLAQAGYRDEEHHQEAMLLGQTPSYYGEQRQSNVFKLGGIRLFLVLAMIIFVLTIVFAVTATFIVDSIAMNTGHEGNTTLTNPFNQSRLQHKASVTMPDVKDLDKQAQPSEKNDFELMEMVSDKGKETPPAILNQYDSQKMNVSSDLIRESYKNALESFHTARNKNNNKTLPAENEALLIRHALVMEMVYHNVVKGLNLSKEQAERGEILLMNATLPSDLCPNLFSDKLHCNQLAWYRSLNGTCNNFKDPHLGSINQPYRRILFPNYDDGVSSPRTKGTRNNLPSARFVSQKVHIDEYREDSEVSSMLPLWAHFIAHDIMYTAKFSEGDTECCKRERSNAVHNSSGKCFPISVSSHDVFYGDNINITCLDFQRAAPHPSCQLGPREQFNKVTSFIDASHIYGTTSKILDSLRTKDPKKLGYMDMDGSEGKYLLPSINETSQCFQAREDIPLSKGQYCFKGGDDRVNDLVTVTALQTIWVRHHNRLAEKLSELNKQWDDEKVFQESRRIVIAQIQHITYNEFLPAILSSKMSDDLLLKSNYSNHTHYSKFDVNTNPGISNEFTIAFQFYLSMMQGLMKKMGPRRDKEEFPQIHKMVLNPGILKGDGELDEFLMGASTHPTTKVDAFIAGQITNHMYQHPNNSYGTDLVALIIQEARDQGIPSYLKVMTKCQQTTSRNSGGRNVQNFSHLREIWDLDALLRVESVYETVDDVDLFTGLLSERPIPGYRIGPTLACIIEDQFSRLRKGDMFWYEGDITLHHFTPEQLVAIRKTTLAKIICENSYKIRKLQSSIMLLPSEGLNPVLHCSELPRTKLNAWKEDGNHHETDEADHDSVHNFTTPEHYDYYHHSGAGDEWDDSFEEHVDN